MSNDTSTKESSSVKKESKISFEPLTASDDTSFSSRVRTFFSDKRKIIIFSVSLIVTLFLLILFLWSFTSKSDKKPVLNLTGSVTPPAPLQGHNIPQRSSLERTPLQPPAKPIEEGKSRGKVVLEEQPQSQPQQPSPSSTQKPLENKPEAPVKPVEPKPQAPLLPSPPLTPIPISVPVTAPSTSASSTSSSSLSSSVSSGPSTPKPSSSSSISSWFGQLFSTTPSPPAYTPPPETQSLIRDYEFVYERLEPFLYTFRTTDVTFPRVGLMNLGNTCYMNAFLQCVLRTMPPDFLNYFINNEKFSKGSLPKAFSNFLELMKKPRSETCVNISEFVYFFTYFCTRDDGTQILPLGPQQDSMELGNEFFSRLLESIPADHEIHLKKCIYSQTTWTSTCTILPEGNKSRKNPLELALQLEMMGNDTKIQTVYDNSKDQSDTSDRCPICSANQEAHLPGNFMTTTILAHFPQTLIIHMKRFENRLKKINSSIVLEGNISLEGNSYSLKGILDHRGTEFNSGHYVARIKEGTKWHLYNDTTVTEIPAPTGPDIDAYILFYQKDKK